VVFLAGNRTREGNGDTLRAKTDEYAQHMYYTEDDFAIVDRVVEVAKHKEVKPTQVALSWMLHKTAHYLAYYWQRKDGSFAGGCGCAVD